MKKFFSVWFVALLCGFTTAVSASVTVTLNCEPSDVTISGLTPDNGAWAKGENTCTLENGYAYVMFTAADNKLGKLVVTDNYSYSSPYTPFPSYSVYVGDGYKLEISCWDMSAVRDASFTLNVADASKFTLTRSDNTTVSLQNGDNTIAFASGSHESGYSEGSFTLRTSESDVLVSVASSTNTNRSNTVNGSVSIYPSKDATVKVYVYNLAEIRTASCTVNVDEPSKLSVYRSGQTIYFTEKTNKVYFVPTGHVSGYQENQLQLQGSSKWYQLTEGANTVSFADSYYWTVTDGATANVQFKAPDVDVPVKFEGAIDAFAKVEVNGVEVDKATWSADGYTVKLGSEISLYGNNTDYTLNSLTIKDNKVDSYASFFNGYAYSFTVTETSDYTINLSATKFVPFDIYLTIDHPEYVEVAYQDASYNKQVVTPATSERTKVTLPAGTSSVTINALNADCYIDSIKDQTGKERYAGSINVNANDEFTVWAGQLNRTSTVYINFDDPTLFQYGGQVQRGASSFATAVVTFQSQSSDPNGTYNNGYKNNEIPFDPQKENLFNISLYGNSGLFYLNQKVRSFGSSDRFENVQDKDVIDVYLRYYTFSFEDESSAYTSAVITTDLVKYGNLWVARPGTIIQFTTDAPSVKLGEAELVANDEGVYSVTLDDNAIVVLDKATPTAIESVTIEKPRNNNVYTLQGILLIQDASEAQIDALPRGLYIINGEKRIVTNRR